MTWHWLICFSLLAGSLAPSTLAGPVAGTVELSGSSHDQGRKASDFSGVVVWLEPRSVPAPPAPTPPPVATIRQREKRFIPHVLAIQVGTTVDFPNDDPIFHNAFSSFDGQIFDIGLYPPGTSRKVVFRRPGIVRVFCNIHPLMSAVIAVVPTPWFAVTDRAGRFRIADAPAGRYRLKIFHERALPETLAALERDLEVGPDGVALDVVRISESGYVPTPHKNKYGKEYPPEVDGHTMYPGGRQ